FFNDGLVMLRLATLVTQFSASPSWRVFREKTTLGMLIEASRASLSFAHAVQRPAACPAFSVALFVPQGHDRIESRSPPSRPHAERHSDERREHERHHYRRRRHLRRPASGLAHHRRTACAEPNAHNPAKHAEDDRLDEELEQDVELRRAERLANADL